ncbi:MAG: DUF1622 domain-containing protein [Gammaproteobacteria bacterium]
MVIICGSPVGYEKGRLNPMHTRHLFEVIVTGVELVAVAIIAIGLIWAFALGARGLLTRRPANEVYERVRGNFGHVLLLGLEVLIAADIVETVTMELTLTSVSTLGLLVLVRTFLSWSIEMETTGRWPWQPRPQNHTSRRAADSE